jgi:lipoprotein-anchoring transpeptidase ErfK/SrfK
MKSIVVFVGAFLSCAIAAEAQAGHVSPKKQEPVRHADNAGQQLISMGWDWDRPQKQQADATNDGNKDDAAGKPSSLTGGGQPHISADAPPKVSFPSEYGAGSIVIDTAGRRLYYVLSASTAYSYPIAVGKQGFTWTGTEKISRKVAWPEWIPPAEMRARKAGLPERMAGGVRNPLGAMALYLGNTLYRIHGTNDAKSIGTAASSGCIRMTNGNVLHLASLADVGTTVHVLKRLPAGIARVAKAGDEG